MRLINLRGLRAERDADAKLARALQCGVGDDAVDAERSEDERAGGEGEQQVKLEIARGERAVDDGVHGADFGTGTCPSMLQMALRMASAMEAGSFAVRMTK